jgi:putative ATPase
MATRARRPPTPDPAETLFGASAKKSVARGAPLADRVRPHALADVVGQKHLLAPGSLLTQAIAGDRVRSMILWGPPGSGKTTLARVIASATRSHFVPFSAVLGSVGELREIVAVARDRLAFQGQRTIVFVDEIHRFNKAQQDAFLPHVEDGTIVLVGATTENPSFAVIAALLSRCKVFRLEPLAADDLVTLLQRALHDPEHGLGSKNLSADDAALRAIAEAAGGDARRALSTLEIVVDYLDTVGGSRPPGQGAAANATIPSTHVSLEAVEAAESHRPLLYDKAGEEHYNVVSAFIKSMRGSDPDAAIYWMMRMLEAGDDPLFVARRMIIFASEDVGNADPRALTVVTAADAALRRVGMPEGIYPLAHACLYLASAPKSNACTVAWQRARALVAERGALPVPKKLRNAVTPLMKAEGYGEGYKYAHDFEGAVVPGEAYLPDELSGTRLYEPSDRGEEARIRDRLAALRGGRSPERR